MDFVATHRDAIAVVNENLRYLEHEGYERIDKLRREWLSVFRSVIELGMKAGELRDLNSEFLTRTLVGMLNSSARWYNPEGSRQPAEIAEIYAHLLLYGLSTSRPAS
ncbi:hypothetical protein CFI00_17135 [Nocardioides sp. S5]|nr:hypothetical protein CFI00_17135 [Nocardioides sp. S5]